MSAPTIPTTYTHKLDPEQTFDVDSTLAGGFDAKHSGSLQTIMSGHLDTTSVLTLKGDPTAPVSTDSKIDLVNLPHFTLQDIKDMMKVRVHVPNYSNVCFKLLGVELFSICMNGEAQIITEPYVPNAAEKCETDCCEPDTRPFPEPTKDPIVVHPANG